MNTNLSKRMITHSTSGLNERYDLLKAMHKVISMITDYESKNFIAWDVLTDDGNKIYELSKTNRYQDFMNAVDCFKKCIAYHGIDTLDFMPHYNIGGEYYIFNPINHDVRMWCDTETRFSWTKTCEKSCPHYYYCQNIANANDAIIIIEESLEEASEE